MASLMAVSSASLMIPAALNVAYDTHSTPDSESSILILSRGTAVILLILYVMYLYFQLKTHTHFFEGNENGNGIPDTPLSLTRSSSSTGAATTMHTRNASEHTNEKPLLSQDRKLILSPTLAIVILLITSLAIALCAEYLLGTISSIVTTLGMNRTFIGLVILPMLGNVAEYMAAMLAARRGKMDFAIGVALGSTMQIALLVTPALVLIGWAGGIPMTLSFEPFGAVVFFLSVIVVTGLIQDGESNYLEGAMLVAT
jgi:Ca2+:H+ antiporter